jgi:16S rRNA (uracil1498-N3)-methyltransferase
LATAGGPGAPLPPAGPGSEPAAPSAVPATLRAAAAHVFVGDLEAPALDGGDRSHLERVLRLQPGEVVGLSDGAGCWRVARWRGGGVLDPAGPVTAEPRPRPEVAVGVALVKGDRLEWAVQKLTELGVDRVMPMATERAVVRWDGERRRRAAQRLRAVARAAAMQSRRVRLPVVDEVTDFADLVTAFAGGSPAGGAGGPGGAGPLAGPAALADPVGEPPSLERPVILVGPEGGWSPAELGAPLPRVSLGPHVLRAETAAVAAGTLLVAIRHGLVAGRPASGALPDAITG